MIKQLILTRLKQYGQSLLESHGKVDIETLHSLAQHKVNSINGTMTKVILTELLCTAKKYTDNKLVKTEQNKDRKVVDANFKVKPNE